MSKRTLKMMVEDFQCPGCVCGSDTNCGKYEPQTLSRGLSSCKSHVAGTTILGIGRIALGLPRGFNRYGGGDVLHIRLATGSNDMPTWDKFNVPVWRYEDNGYLFVRTYSPRTNMTCVDVIDISGGTFNWTPILKSAIDVGEFINDID